MQLRHLRQVQKKELLNHCFRQDFFGFCTQHNHGKTNGRIARKYDSDGGVVSAKKLLSHSGDR